MSTITTTTTTTVTVPVIQEPTRKESHVTTDSLLQLTEGRPIVVSYGYTNAGWNQTNEAMQKILGEDNVWNYTLGQNYIPHHSSSGETVVKINVPEAGAEGLGTTARGTIAARRLCKAGLIDAIFHNYNMMKNGHDDFIPIIFSTSLSYATGGQKPIEKNSRTTCSEVELLRKLCTDTDLPEDFRQLARRSLKFIDVQDVSIEDFHSWEQPEEFTRSTTYSFTEVDAPWEVAGYAEQRAQVKATWLGNNPDFQRPAGSKGAGAAHAFDWKNQLQMLLDPDTGIIPGPDEVQPEAQEEQTISTTTAQEEPTSLAGTVEAEGISTSEG